MLKPIIAALTLVTFALAARAEPDEVEAILIKQFLVCDGALLAGCESFGRRAFADALIVFAAAAENGDAAARNNLGMLYETGAGVKRSEPEAARLYRIAAEAGVPLAQYNLAMLTVTKHVIGEVTDPDERDRDMATAYMWLTFASERGLKLAVDSRQELIEFMTPKALQAGERRLQDRKKK